MINFETENLVIVCFPQGAGGKFLINCLGLSSDAVLQCADLATAQLDNRFNPEDKINFLNHKIQETSGQWTDLDLGCFRLFGVDNRVYLDHPPDLVKKFFFNEVICELSNSPKKIFIVAHCHTWIESYRSVWPNAKIIYFTNVSPFIHHRSRLPVDIKKTWEHLRGDSWPVAYPLNFNEFNSMDESIKQEFSNNKWEFKSLCESNLIHTNHEKMRSAYSNIIYCWDALNYFSVDKVVYEIKNIYQLLNLSKFNENYIRQYYFAWQTKLEELKHEEAINYNRATR